MKIHKIKGYINNLFIAEYNDSLLLLDGGSPADIDVIERFCTETLNRPVTDIRLAVVSHMHPDHSGAAPLLRKKYGTFIAACRNIDQWYAGPTGWLQHKLDCFMAQLVAFRQKTKIRRIFSRRITRPDFLLDDRDSLPFYPGWMIIHTPGHTTHDIALFHTGEKILYCGDSIIEVRGRYYLPLPVIFRERLAESYRKLALCGAEKILIPHGNIPESEMNHKIFETMEQLLNEPPNRIMRRIRWLSVWSPDIWKPVIRRILLQ